jgi:hypothetical protein
VVVVVLVNILLVKVGLVGQEVGATVVRMPVEQQEP